MLIIQKGCSFFFLFKEQKCLYNFLKVVVIQAKYTLTEMIFNLSANYQS